MTFRSHMEAALSEARAAGARGEVPVGAAVVRDGRVLAAAGNRTRELSDPTAHAEMLAIRAAARERGAGRLVGCEMWVTLEPCAMCAAAIATARIERLYFGADDPKSGGVVHGARVFAHPQTHHAPEVYGGIAADASADLLKRFFASRRP